MLLSSCVLAFLPVTRKQDLLQILPVFLSLDATAAKFQRPWVSPAAASYAALDQGISPCCFVFSGRILTGERYTESSGLWGLDLVNVLLTKLDLMSYGFEEMSPL